MVVVVVVVVVVEEEEEEEAAEIGRDHTSGGEEIFDPPLRLRRFHFRQSPLISGLRGIGMCEVRVVGAGGGGRRRPQ